MWRLSTDLMLVARFDATITAINPAWTALLGWREEELIGKSFLLLVHPMTWLRPYRRRRGWRRPPRCALRTAIGRVVGIMCVSWTAVPDENFIHALARDMSIEKATAARLEEAQEALRQSQKLEAMGQLTGGVAHDFNNLLSPIIGGLDLLQRREFGDERARRIIAGALASAERAKTLVQRLLAFARRQPLQPAAVNVARIIRDMSGLLASTLGPRIELSVEVPQDLPAARADANQLEMALLNLTVNARDAMPEGGHLLIAAARMQLHCNREGCRRETMSNNRARYGQGDGLETLARCIEPFFSNQRGGTRHRSWAVDGARTCRPAVGNLRITSRPQGHALNSGYQ